MTENTVRLVIKKTSARSSYRGMEQVYNLKTSKLGGQYKKNILDNRVEWIDIAKGITILLVIIGHTVGGALRGAIFSFHMPLFFILSCITFKCSENGEQLLRKTERAFKHLIIPAIVMYCLCTLIWCVENYSSFSSLDYVKNFIKQRILIAVFSSGVDVQIFDTEIPAIGIPWFLVVLFCGRTLFDYLHLRLSKRNLVVVSVILSIVGIIFGKIQWLPLSFDVALAVLPFFIVGRGFCKFNVTNKVVKKFIICVLAWSVLYALSYVFTHNYMILARRRYTLFPVCYITAIAGTLMVSEFSVILCKLKRFSVPIKYLGKNSLYMLCIHMLDSSLLQSIWNISGNTYVNALCRVGVDAIVFVVLMVALELRNANKNPEEEIPGV